MALLFCTILTTGCYDDSALWRELNEHEARIVKLELLTEEYNTNLSSLQDILNAMKDKDYVTNVVPVERNGKDVGMTIIFARKEPVTIYFGEISVGDLGGAFPEIGVGKDTDGNYYWTLDGVWLTDDKGDKIMASGQKGPQGDQGQAGKDGVTPKLKITDNKWYVSYDNEKTWVFLGDVPAGGSGSAGPDGSAGSNLPTTGGCVFSGVKVADNTVVLTLTDGTEIVVPKKFKVTFVQSEPQSTSVTISGVAHPVSPDYEVGVYYSTDPEVKVQTSKKLSCFLFGKDNSFSISISDLQPETTYYWRSYVSMYGDVEYGEVQSFTTPQMLFRPVTEIRMVRKYVQGGGINTTLRYAYDNSFRVTSMELKMESLNADAQVEDTWNNLSLITYKNDRSIGLVIYSGDGGGESYTTTATAYVDDEGKVVRVVEADSQGDGSSESVTTLEYYPDGMQKKVSITEPWGTRSSEYSYSDGAMTGITAVSSGDGYQDSDQIVIDPQVMYPERIYAGDVNVNLNMLLMGAEFGNAYNVLSHIGCCGTFLGNYLFQKTEMWGIQKNDYYLGETDDKNYKQHVVTYDYVSVEEDDGVADVGYLLSLMPGYINLPTYFSASQRYAKYKVEYDIIAGNKTEYSDPEYPTYVLVKANETRTYVGAATEGLMGSITYLGMSEGDTGSNEGFGSNEGEWEN